MIPYFLVMMIFFVSLYFDNKRKMKIQVSWFVFMLLSLFIGLRYNVGTDYISYTQLYYIIRDGTPVDIEPAFKVLCLVLPSPYCVFFAIGICSLFFIHKFIETKKYPNYIFVAYSLLYLLQWNAGVIRQGFAIAVFLYATKYLNKNIIKYVFWILLAAFMQKSILICLAFPIIVKIRFRNITALCCIAGGILIHFEFHALMFVFSKQEWLPYHSYFSNYLYIGDSKLGLQTIIRMCAFPLILLITKYDEHPDAEVLIDSSFALFVLSAVLWPAGIAMRLLKPVEIFVLLQLLDYLPGKIKKMKRLFIFATVVAMSVYFFFTIICAPMYVPYETFLDKPTSNDTVSVSAQKMNRLIGAYKKNGWTMKQINNLFQGVQIQ